MSTTTSIPPLRERPAWNALERALRGDPRPASARAVRARTPPAASASPPRAPACSWTTPRTGSPTRRSRSSSNWREQSGLAERTEAMFSGERINVSENRSVLHVALRMPKGSSLDRRRGERRRRGPRGARPHGRLRRPRPLRRVEGPHRQADPQHRQHRDRRLGPGAGDGLRGPAPLLAARPHLPLRLQRRLDRLRRGHPRPRRRRDPVHRLLQDVHDARDDDQRPRPRATGR